jgi:RHS repeat-associated protein
VDANGEYGGLQGVGGLEAVVDEESGTWTALVDDYHGHIIGSIATANTVKWSLTQCSGYGPAPGSPVFVVAEGASVVQATAWRGQRLDVTGFYCLGARYYEPTSGRFLSPDPLGHSASLSLYDYAGGDPIL